MTDKAATIMHNLMYTLVFVCFPPCYNYSNICLRQLRTALFKKKMLSQAPVDKNDQSVRRQHNYNLYYAQMCGFTTRAFQADCQLLISTKVCHRKVTQHCHVWCGFFLLFHLHHLPFVGVRLLLFLIILFYLYYINNMNNYVY